MNQMISECFQMISLQNRKIIVAMAILLSLGHLVPALNFSPSKLPISAVTSASKEACAGMRARYFCDIENPATFHICLGRKRFTMICPGLLHFSERTQTCDWPEVANCRRLSMFPPLEPPSPATIYNSSEVGFYLQPSDASFEPQEVTTKGFDSPMLPYLSDHDAEPGASGMTKRQQRPKRRYKTRKPGKALVLNSVVSRWWNNPPASVASDLPGTAEASKGEVFQTDSAEATYPQPYNAKMIQSNSSASDIHKSKDNKMTNSMLEENFQNKARKREFEPNPRYYKTEMKVPWYRPLNKIVDNQTIFPPSLSFKKRNSRESKMRPHKPVIISPFKPFITERQAAPRRSVNRKLSSSVYEAPLGQWSKIPSPENNERIVSLNSKDFEKDKLRSNSRQGEIGAYEKFSNLNPSKHIRYSKHEDDKMIKAWKHRISQSGYITQKPFLELNEPQEAVTKTLLIKDYGSLRSHPDSERSTSLKFKENGFVKASDQSFGDHGPESNFKYKPYRNSAARLKLINLQRNPDRSNVLNRALHQNGHQLNDPELVWSNDWKSVHGVAGIPDYNPDQAIGFYSPDTGNLVNSVSVPGAIQLKHEGTQGAKINQNYSYRNDKSHYFETPSDKISNAANRNNNSTFHNSGDLIQRHMDVKDKRTPPSKFRAVEPMRGLLNKASSHFDPSKEWYDSMVEPDHPGSFSGKEQDAINIIDTNINSAASKTRTPVKNNKLTERITNGSFGQTSEPLKNVVKAFSPTENYGHTDAHYSRRNTWLHSNQPKHGSGERAGMAQTSRTSSSNLSDGRTPERKHADSFRKEIEYPSYSGYTRINNRLESKEPANKHVNDIPRIANFKNSQSSPFLKSQETFRHKTEDFPETKNNVDYIAFPRTKTPQGDQRLAVVGNHQKSSRFTQYSATPLRTGQRQSREHSAERKTYFRENKRTFQTKAPGFLSAPEKQPYHRESLPKPPSYSTRPPTSGLSRITYSLNSSNNKGNRISKPSEQERYPVTLNYALHGLGYPRRSQRTYALHRPSNRNSNIRQFPVKTKDVSHYSLYGLNNRPETSAQKKDQGPVPFNDSRFKLREKKARGNADEALSKDLIPRTSPIEKYKTRREKCSKKWCQLPNCRCVGTDIPGGLNRDEIPQIVMLTFDDSISIQNINYYRRLFNKTLKNPNGCPFKGTFFVSGDNTDYKLVKEVYRSGHEIASHTISHRSPTTWWAYAGYDNWNSEVVGMRERLHKNAGIPIEEIRGMRAPFLQVGGDAQYAMLAENNFRYDTSMVTGDLHSSRKSPIWPFTLDTAPNGQTCSLSPCPRRSYPGLWEVPLVRWYGSNNMACAMPDACTIGSGSKGSLKFLEENFKRHYQRNKAPFGIFIHASWFGRQRGTLEGLAQFLDLVSHMEDVWVVSVSQALDWIQHPVPIGHLDTIKSWTC